MAIPIDAINLMNELKFSLSKILCSSNDPNTTFFFSNDNSKDLYLMNTKLSTDIKIYYTTNLPLPNHGLVLQTAINILHQAFLNRGGSVEEMIDTIKIRFYILTLLRIYYKYTNGISNIDFNKLEEIFKKNLTTLPTLSSLFKIVGNNIVLFEDIKIFGLRTPISFNIFEILSLPINLKPPLPATRGFIKIFSNVKIFKFLDYDNANLFLNPDITTISGLPNKLRIEVCYDNDIYALRPFIDINNTLHLKCANITAVNNANYLIHNNNQDRALITNAILFHTFSNDHLRTIDLARGKAVFLYTCEFYKQINIFLEYHIYNMCCMIPCDINNPFPALPPNLVYPHVIIDNIDKVYADHSALVLRNNLGNYIKQFNDSQNDLYVYRFQSMNLFQYDHNNDASLFNITVGKQLFFPIYLSTTLTDKTYDSYFINSTSVLLKIKLDLSNILNLKDFLIITSKSYFPPEQEILINRNSMFDITGINDVLIDGGPNGRLTIKCIELDFRYCIPSNTCSAYNSTTFKNNFLPGPIPVPVNQNDIRYKQLSFFGGNRQMNTTKKVVFDTNTIKHLTEFKYKIPLDFLLPNISNLPLIEKFDEYKLFYVNYMNLFNIKNIKNINEEKLKELFEILYNHISNLEIVKEIITEPSNEEFEKKYLKYKNKYLLNK
jgi:hypothetical protein